MLKYSDYLIGAAHCYELLSENEFNKIVENFSNINSIDYSNFEFGYDDLEQYILNYIISKELINDYYVECIDENKYVCVDSGFESSLNELNKLKEILNKYGYSLENYDELVSDMKTIMEEKYRSIKSKIINKLNEMTVEQLEKLLSEWK